MVPPFVWTSGDLSGHLVIHGCMQDGRFCLCTLLIWLSLSPYALQHDHLGFMLRSRLILCDAGLPCS